MVLCASAINHGQLPFRYITTTNLNWLYIYIYNCYSAILALGMARSRSGDILADEEEGWGVTLYADLLLFTGNRTIAIGS